MRKSIGIKRSEDPEVMLTSIPFPVVALVSVGKLAS